MKTYSYYAYPVLLGIVSVPSISFAQDDVDPGFASADVLTDAELDQQRGRFIVSGQSYYFGLLMQVQYLDNAGLAQQASMQLEFKPEGLTVSVAEHDGTNASTNPLPTELYGQASGLQQRIQIAGENNNVKNDFVFGTGKLLPLVDGQQIALGQVLVSQDGQRLYSALPGQLGIQIQLDNSQAQQMLISQDGSRQLLQAINVDGSQYQMSNLSQVQFEGINYGKLTNSILSQQLLTSYLNGR